MSTLKKLFELRESLDTYERELGIDQLSEVEKAVLEFVMNKKDATITELLRINILLNIRYRLLRERSGYCCLMILLAPINQMLIDVL